MYSYRDCDAKKMKKRNKTYKTIFTTASVCRQDDLHFVQERKKEPLLGPDLQNLVYDFKG